MQVLPADKRRSFGERLNEGLGKGLAFAQEWADQVKSEKREAEAVEQGKALFNIDTSGMDKETRKAIFAEAMKTKGKKEIKEFEFGELKNLNKDRNPISDGVEKGDGNRKYDKPFSNEQLAKAAIINPALERTMSDQNKEVFEREKLDRKETIAFHQETEKYDEELLKQTKSAKKQIMAIEDIEKALNSKNVKPTSAANVFSMFGDLGKKISNAVLNKDEATLKASVPQLLEGWKEVFGVRLSDADLKILEDKLPEIGKSIEANKAVVKILKKYSQGTLLRSQISAEIKKKNKGLRPLGYREMVEERFDEMTKPVKVINPNTGKVIEIPAYQVGDAIESGGRLAEEEE